MALCSVAGAGLQAAHRCIRALAGQRCSTAALRAPLVGGRAAVADRRRRLVLPLAQQQEDPALALLEAEDLSQNERIAAGKAVAAATNRWGGGRGLRCRSNGACWLHARRPLEGLGEAVMHRLSCAPAAASGTVCSVNVLHSPSMPRHTAYPHRRLIAARVSSCPAVQPLPAAHLAVGGVERCTPLLRHLLWHPGGGVDPSGAGAMRWRTFFDAGAVGAVGAVGRLHPGLPSWGHARAVCG